MAIWFGKCGKTNTMYKVSISDMQEVYLKGYVDGLQGRPQLESPERVIEWLTGEPVNYTITKK
jgi:hypothetical protein|tara:strand:+ start:201 stop:389 length:189 start_codon:yes stop_codon:yes gene_type:complete